jgi:hypothetical protein
VQLVADRVTEGAETMTLAVAGQSQAVVVNDTSEDPVFNLTIEQDDFAGANRGSAADNLYIGRVSAVDENTTYTEGDQIDGGAGSNSLRLFMDAGTFGDGVKVSNIQTLDLRLTESNNSTAAQLVMTDWDSNLEKINILSNKSVVVIRDQQTIAEVSISDQSTGTQTSSYTLGYAAGVLDGGSDHLNLTLNNVNGTGGSAVVLDAGMESLAINVADRAGAQYASNINLTADDVESIRVTGGRVGQAFTLNAIVAAGAAFDSTGFAGNTILSSADIKTATLGVGNDTVTVTGQANLADASYNLGEGDNTISVDGALGGAISAGAGLDRVTVTGATLAGSSIALGAGGSQVDVTGAHGGSIVATDGVDTVTAASTAVGSIIGLGLGNDAVTVFGLHAGSIFTGRGADVVTVDATAAGSAIDVGHDNNTITVRGAHAGSILALDGADTVSVGTTAAGSGIALGNGGSTVTVNGAHAGSILALDGADTVSVGTTAAGSGIALGNGGSTITVNGAHAGSIVAGAGIDSVSVGGGTAAGSSIAVGSDDNIVAVTGNHEGSISAGDGTNTITITADMLAGSSVTVGNGNDNNVAVQGDVVDGDITFGNGDDNVLTIGGALSAAGPGTVLFGDGSRNQMTVGSVDNDSVLFGAGSDNALTVSDVVTDSTISFRGDNATLTVGDEMRGTTASFVGTDATLSTIYDVNDSTVSFEGDNATLTVGDDIRRSTVSFVGDSSTLQIDDVLTDSTVSFEGDNATFIVGDDIRRTTVSFVGDSSTLQIDDELTDSTITFAGVNSTLTIGGEIERSTINFGGGTNTATFGDSVQDGSAVTFGSGADTLVMSELGGEDSLYIGSVNNASETRIDMGAGDDTATLHVRSGGESNLVGSGGFLAGGADNDSLTITTNGTLGNVIERTEFQRATVVLDGIYARGDEVSIDIGATSYSATFQYAEIQRVTLNFDQTYLETQTYSLTVNGVTVSHLVPVGQGGANADAVSFALFEALEDKRNNGTEPEQDALAGIIATHSGNNITLVGAEFNQDNFTATSASTNVTDNAGSRAVDSVGEVAGRLASLIDEDIVGDFIAGQDGNVVTITGTAPRMDVAIASTNATTSVAQIADTRITGFEELNLVMLDSQLGEGHSISANFDLIEGVQSIVLDSQVDRVNSSLDGAGYDAFDQGRETTFNLQNLAGGESITVKGSEVTATGNRQVEQITVGAADGDHLVDDKITVTLAGATVTYLVTEADLAAATAQADANNIAQSLLARINGTPGLGFTASASANVLTLVGATGDDVDFGVSHTREDQINVVPESSPATTWLLSGDVHDFNVGDVVTITIDSVSTSYTLTAADFTTPACDRMDADRVSAQLAAAVGGTATAAWGVLTVEDDFTYQVTRTVDAEENKTTSNGPQSASATDDGEIDVVINASLAAGATNTTMNLTVAGRGDFDLSIQPWEESEGEGPAFTRLDLKLGDAYSHFIDTNGGEGNFRHTITVADVTGVDTTGQSISLDTVLAHTVNTTASAANFSIDQLSARGEDAAFASEFITVATGGGDDHLTTLAQSAINSDSSIDLGLGSNRLTLGWVTNGQDITIDSADLADIGGIDYRGNLTQLDLLNDVRLDEQNNTLTMPGGVGGVETLTFTNVYGYDAQLSIEGAANDFTILADRNFDLYMGYSMATLTVADAAGVQITGDLTVRAGRDVYFNLGNTRLDSMTVVAADRDANVEIGYNSDAVFILGDVSITAGDDADLDIVYNENTRVTLGNVNLVGASGSGYDADVSVQDNDDLTLVLGDVTLDAADADFRFTDNTSSIAAVGQVSISGATDRGADGGEDTNMVYIYDNASSTVAIAGIDIANSSYARVNIVENDDSNIEVAGTINLASESGTNLSVVNNHRTNVSLAADSTITLVACDHGAYVGITDNLNDYDPLSANPNAVTAVKDVEIVLGNLSLNAGELAIVDISGNDDDTFYGELSIDVGTVTTFAHGNSGLGINDNIATVINVGAVSITAQEDGGVRIDNNDGNLYGVTRPDGTVYRSDVADIDIASVTVNNGGMASMGIGRQDLAQVSIGNVTLNGGTNAGLEIVYNGEGEDSVYYYNLPASEQPVSITLGDVAITAKTGLAGASIGLDYSDFKGSEGEDGPFSGGNVNTQVSIDSLALTSEGSDENAEANFVIANNTGEQGKGRVTVGNVTTSSATSTNFFVYNNDLVSRPAFTDPDLSIGNVTMEAADNANLSIFDNSGNSDDAMFLAFGDVTLTAAIAGEDGNAQLDFKENSFVTATFGDVTLAGSDASMFVDGNSDSNIDFGVVSMTTTSGASDDIADVYINGNRGSVITVESITTMAAGNALVQLSGNSSDSNITVGNISLTTTSDNSAAGLELVYNSDSSIDLDNVSLTGEGSAGVLIGYDFSNDAGEDADFFEGGNTNTAITLGDVTITANGGVEGHSALLVIANNFGEDGENSRGSVTLGDVTMAGNRDGMFFVSNNSMTSSDGEFAGLVVGDVTISVSDDVSLSIFDNAGYSDAAFVMDFGKVTLTSSDDDAQMDFKNNEWVDATFGDVSISSVNKATVFLNDNSDSSVELGAVTLDREGGELTNFKANFTVKDNTRSEVVIESLHTTSDKQAWFEVTGNSDSSVTVSGSVTLDASDNVLFEITENMGEDDSMVIEVGDVVINAGNDVYFDVDGSDSDVTLGDITIEAGKDAVGVASSVNVFSTVYIDMNEVRGADTIGIKALSSGTGVGNINARFEEISEVTKIGLAGTNADVRLSGNMGPLDAIQGTFTLDLSGMTGTFDGQGGITYDPTSDSRSTVDSGTYVQTHGAVFDNEVKDVVVKIGSGDLIYNAQHSNFGGSSDDFAYSGGEDSNFDADWFNNEGWFSLGAGLDLTPGQKTQTLHFDAGGVSDGESSVFDIQIGDQTYALTVNAGGGGGSDSDSGDFSGTGVIGGTGISYSVNGSYSSNSGLVSVVLSGPEDGSGFTLSTVTGLQGQFGGALVSNNSVHPQPAIDGGGNAASELFRFVGNDIGDLVIGGFRPNGFFSNVEVDRLDFSAFTGGTSRITNAGDLVITIEKGGSVGNSHGYFDDVIIDFVDQNYGSVRLVGAGEYFTDANVNGIANSVIFA